MEYLWRIISIKTTLELIMIQQIPKSHAFLNNDYKNYLFMLIHKLIFFSRWFFDQATDDLNKRIAQKKKGMLSKIASFLTFKKKGSKEVNFTL